MNDLVGARLASCQYLELEREEFEVWAVAWPVVCCTVMVQPRSRAAAEAEDLDALAAAQP